MAIDYIQYFEPLERDREAGRVKEALLKSQEALIEAGRSSDPVLALNAYAHQLLIYKDQFTHTNNEFYLHIMHSLAQAGLALADDLHITGQSLAVMYLRNGDYFFHYKQYDKAVIEIRRALDVLTNTSSAKPGEYAEYESHLGKALVYAGQSEEGLQHLQAAVQATAGPTELREFHQLIVHSGNLLRLLVAYDQVGMRDKAQELLREVYPIAIELKAKHTMPIRLEQVEKIATAWHVQFN